MKLLLSILALCLISIIPAFAELDLSNQKIVSLDGKLILEFGENIQTFKRGQIIETPQLSFGIITLTDKTVLLSGEHTNILGNSFSVRLDDGKIYAKNNQDGTFTVKVLTLGDNGFQKQTFASVLQSVETIESPEITQPIEETVTLPTELVEEETQYIPELLMTTSHNSRTYWKELFNIEVMTYDSNINNNPDRYPFEGKIDGVDINVVLSVDNVQVATLNGITEYGQWKGEYYFVENISVPGEYVVDVIASYLGKTVSDTSTMFVIGTIAGSGQSSGIPVANAGVDLTIADTVDPDLDGTGSTDPNGDPLTFSWVIQSGLGALTNENTATPTYESLGATTAIILLTVTDPTGKSSTDSVTITVT